jgi:hypothetical protein
MVVSRLGGDGLVRTAWWGRLGGDGLVVVSQLDGGEPA